ncbi:BQ5605_C002g01481 [Microbotryum silenes-dioicae]|uniref:BQ5605_C002g01481 protein n=1 Tax=Microbotryum silenes-dioicae TaxID=796604 RepID=A0A2X0M2R6_9BASI|nr:BQ5605_C002g01481 [Microbotryum silenes-dioicae]
MHERTWTSLSTETFLARIAMDCFSSPKEEPSTRDQGPSLQSSEMIELITYAFFCKSHIKSTVTGYKHVSAGSDLPELWSIRVGHTSSVVLSRMIDSLTRHPYPILTPAPMLTLGPTLAVGSTSAVSSMKQGSIISALIDLDARAIAEAWARFSAVIVGERRRSNKGFVVLYDARMSVLAGIAELVNRRHRCVSADSLFVYMCKQFNTTHAADLICVHAPRAW